MLVMVCSSTYAAQQPVPCSGEEYHQFDFWIGEWEVFDPKGKKVGENKIEKILNGCVLKESWVSASPNRGHSFNIYDQTKKQWHQTWVDNGGNLLQLDGKIHQGSMILKGMTQGQNGQVLNRITWTPEEENKKKYVRQVWDISHDNGVTWQTIFDGLYVEK